MWNLISMKIENQREISDLPTHFFGTCMWSNLIFGKANESLDQNFIQISTIHAVLRIE